MAKGFLLAAIALYLVFVVQGTYPILSCKRYSDSWQELIVPFPVPETPIVIMQSMMLKTTSLYVTNVLERNGLKTVPEYRLTASNCRQVKYINFREIWIQPENAFNKQEWFIKSILRASCSRLNRYQTKEVKLVLTPVFKNYLDELYRAVGTDPLNQGGGREMEVNLNKLACFHTLMFRTLHR